MRTVFKNINRILVIPETKEEKLLLSVFVQSDRTGPNKISIGEMTSMSGNDLDAEGIDWTSMEIIAEHKECTCDKPKKGRKK